MSKQQCPRRLNEWGPWNRDDEDKWREDDTCSFCGSLNPDVLMDRIEQKNVELGPTDKNYKAYVYSLNGKPFLKSYRNCPIDSSCKGPDTCEHWVTEETTQTKFYFQHFSQEQMKRFVDLYNERQLKVGYPGHFYVWPFFMRKSE